MGRSRREMAQQAPAPGASYADFPAYTVSGESEWFRHHQERPVPDRGAWYFASVPPGGGRFDLAEPRGTCYLATSRAAAVRELIGPDFLALGWVPGELLRGRIVSRLRVPAPVRVANVSVASAADRGVSSELTTTTDYPLTQQWAAAFARAGFAGIRYALRFTPGRARGLALFGPSGPADGLPGDPLAQKAADVVDRMGLAVVDEPHSRAVEVVSPSV